MPQEVRLWCIGNDDRLLECAQGSLNLEARLEEWLARDISILADDLLVIGRQVEMAFGGRIDLLCMERTGDLVIVELKRDKTPREITAQTLDYASWVNDLSRDAIASIAAQYLGSATSLDEAFKQSFDEELPDTLNDDHRMLIVASKIDASSERIIKYLSSKYGVNINAVTFHYLKSDEGKEFMARVFLIDPSDVEYQALTKGPSKRTGAARRSHPWDEDSFFAKLAERGSESETRIARALFAWGSEHMNRMDYGSGMRMASFMPVDGPSDAWFSPFRVFTGYRAAYVEIPLGGPGMQAPPFDNPDRKLQLVASINSIPGVRIAEDLGRFPSIDLVKLAEGDRLARFLEVMTWAVEEVKKGTEKMQGTEPAVS